MQKTILFILNLAFGVSILADPSQTIDSIPVDSQPTVVDITLTSYPIKSLCETIPTTKQAICLIKTESQYGPYNDVVFYHRSETGYLRYLKSETGSVAIFGGIHFSKGGKYLFESWAEEGHPSLVFYKTEDYITGMYDRGNKVRGVINDYHFDRVRQFSDEGQIAYTQFNNVSEVIKCPKYIIDETDNEKYCLVSIQLKK